MCKAQPPQTRRRQLPLIAIFSCGTALCIFSGRLRGSGNYTSIPAESAGFVQASVGSAARGQALYAHHCASCHGPLGRGDGSAGRDLDTPPTDLMQPQVQEKSDAQLFRQITQGRRPMPSFKKVLSEEDRWCVIEYIRLLGQSAAQGSGK